MLTLAGFAQDQLTALAIFRIFWRVSRLESYTPRLLRVWFGAATVRRYVRHSIVGRTI